MQRFPFHSHRTMAEVVETEDLAALRAMERLPKGLFPRLNGLLCREQFNNPPPVAPVTPDDAA